MDFDYSWYGTILNCQGYYDDWLGCGSNSDVIFSQSHCLKQCSVECIPQLFPESMLRNFDLVNWTSQFLLSTSMIKYYFFPQGLNRN